MQAGRRAGGEWSGSRANGCPVLHCHPRSAGSGLTSLVPLPAPPLLQAAAILGQAELGVFSAVLTLTPGSDWFRFGVEVSTHWLLVCGEMMQQRGAPGLPHGTRAPAGTGFRPRPARPRPDRARAAPLLVPMLNSACNPVLQSLPRLLSVGFLRPHVPLPRPAALPWPACRLTESSRPSTTAPPTPTARRATAATSPGRGPSATSDGAACCADRGHLLNNTGAVPRRAYPCMPMLPNLHLFPQYVFK